MTNSHYKWLKATQIYPDRGEKSYRLKRFRYLLRSWLHWSKIKRLEQFINANPLLIPLLNRRVNFGYPLVHRFLDKRFNSEQRFQCIKDNLLFLSTHLSTKDIDPIWEYPLSFGEIVEEFEIILNINEQQPMEGYLALELRYKPTRQLVYLLTFGKLNSTSLLIAAVQGPNYDGSKELVKQLTKKCHGLRPAYLMVEMMKGLTQILGYQQLLGIPQKYQNKSRLIQSKRYIVNYNTIFQESGGILDQYWLLPITNKRSLDNIASNKRSMYRKRYEMLDKLMVTIQDKLRA